MHRALRNSWKSVEIICVNPLLKVRVYMATRGSELVFLIDT